MKEISVLNLNGELVGKESIELDTDKINADILHRYVVAYLANQRQGNASTKTRGEVSGGGRKPWRQKGTGRARVGSTRNPIWRHGGIVFGPRRNRDYSQRLPGKMKTRALKDAMKTRILDDKLFLLSIASGITEPRTRIFTDFLKKAGFTGKILMVLDKNNTGRLAIVKSLRNIDRLEYCYADQINPYEILVSDVVVAQAEIFPLIKKISLGASDA